MDRAGVVGDDGPTHHGTFDISYFSLMPNMTLVAPRDTTELREMTLWMAGYDKGPSAMRYPRGAGDDRLPESRSPIQYGKGETLREGSDVTILAVGSMVSPAWQAALLLEAEGISAEVINARFLKPFDAELLLKSVRKTGRLIVVEENVRIGGFGQQVRDWLLEHELEHVKSELMAIPDKFVEHGPQPVLLRDLGLDDVTIAATARDLVKSGSRR